MYLVKCFLHVYMCCVVAIHVCYAAPVSAIRRDLNCSSTSVVLSFLERIVCDSLVQPSTALKTHNTFEPQTNVRFHIWFKTRVFSACVFVHNLLL